MSTSWHQANQQYLMGAIAQVRQALERKLAQTNGESVELEAIAMPSVSFPDHKPAALDTLCQLFKLSPFERNILLLCAGVELSNPIASLCGALHGDARQAHASFSLALSIFSEVRWNALNPHAPLRYWQMVELGAARFSQQVRCELTSGFCITCWGCSTLTIASQES